MMSLRRRHRCRTTRSAARICNMGAARPRSTARLYENAIRPHSQYRCSQIELQSAFCSDVIELDGGISRCSSSCAPTPKTDGSETGPRPGAGSLLPARRPGGATSLSTPHDGHRDAPILAHDELRRGGQLVGDADLRGDELAAPLPSRRSFRSMTAATPAQPIATSVTPRRHGRPNVSETITQQCKTEQEFSKPAPDAPGGGGPSPQGNGRPVRHVGGHAGINEPVRSLTDPGVLRWRRILACRDSNWPPHQR